MKRTAILIALSSFLIIGLAASSVQADPSAGKLDNGKTSLTKLVPDLITGTPPSTKDDNYMFTLNGEQCLWAPKGASVPRAEGGRKEDFSVPTQDYAINRPGVGLFYRAAYTPKDRNPWNINVSGGRVHVASFRAGLMIGWGSVSTG